MVRNAAKPMPDVIIRQVVFESIDLITTARLNTVIIKMRKNAVLVFFNNSFCADIVVRYKCLIKINKFYILFKLLLFFAVPSVRSC